MGLVTYLGSGGKVGDTIKAEVTCDKCKCTQSLVKFIEMLIGVCSWQNNGVYVYPIHEREE
jgi:hypothetical protein